MRAELVHGEADQAMPTQVHTLYALPIADDVATETATPRRFMAVHGGTKSAVLTGARRLTLVPHALGDGVAGRAPHRALLDRTNLPPRKEMAAIKAQVEYGSATMKPRARAETESTVVVVPGAVTVTVAHAIVDFTLSTCGGFVAVADDEGVLRIFKCDGHELLAYPVIHPRDATTDRITAIAFATSSRGREQQDLVVVTRAGVLVRLGDLHLETMERILVERPRQAGYATVGTMIQVQSAHVGEQRGGKSLLLARRYESALYVIVANHGHALSVWKVRVGVAVTAAAANNSFKRTAASSLRPDMSSITDDMQFGSKDMCIVVQSRRGVLSWWDWWSLSFLFQLELTHIQQFVLLKHGNEQESCPKILVSRRYDGGTRSTIEVYKISRLRPRAQRIAKLGTCADLRGNSIVNLTVDSGAGTGATDGPRVLISIREKDHMKTQMMVPFWQHNQCAQDGDSEDDLQTNQAGATPTSVARSLVDIDVSRLLLDGEEVMEWEQAMQVSMSGIGNGLEDSREIINNLHRFASHLRHFQEQLPATSLPPQILGWLESIRSVSYKWTTFLLVVSSIPTESYQLRSRWRSFCSTDMPTMMQTYLAKGMMRSVAILWKRHACDDVVRDIGTLLQCMPQYLPFQVYEQFMRVNVIPAVVQFAERRTGTIEAAASIDSLTDWILDRIHASTDHGDLDTALNLSSLIGARSNVNNGQPCDLNLRWATLCMRSGDTNEENAITRLANLGQALKHMKYLEDVHQIKMPLAIFIEHTPSMIAMRMLGRVTSAEQVQAEIRTHVRPYLHYCDVPVDSVLSKYAYEAVASSSEMDAIEQDKLLFVVDEIADVEARAIAVLTLFKSLLPPFSPTVKAFAIKSLEWGATINTDIQEHVRFMEIQDMLTGYGIKRFLVADSRSGSRLISHILCHLARATVFVDAIRLVDAYHYMSRERAALEYFENLLTFQVPPNATHTSELTWRSSQVKLVLAEWKKQASDAASLLVVMDEVVSLGLSLLLREETQQGAVEMATKRALRQTSSWFMLAMLEAMVEIFLPEADKLMENKLSSPRTSRVITAALLVDLQNVRKMEAEWGMVVSVDTLRDSERVEQRIRSAITPGVMFSGQATVANARAPGTGVVKNDKGKKRVISTTWSANSNRLKQMKTCNSNSDSTTVSSPCTRTREEQKDDGQTLCAFNLDRYARSLGMRSDRFQAVVAEYAAESGDILRAMAYSRDLFSRRRVRAARRSDAIMAPRLCVDLETNQSATALTNISKSISKYTAMNTETIYGHAQGYSSSRTPSQIARMKAPSFSLELLEYSLCVCDTDAFEETLLLLKNATLLNDVLQFIQADGVRELQCPDLFDVSSSWRIYERWFRGDTCGLPSTHTMTLATRYVVAEHRLLVQHSNVALGLTDAINGSISGIPEHEFVASKRFISYLVENNAELLSLQVMLAMRHIPEDALVVIQAQVAKLLSSVFQSQQIDNHLALGLMLTMEQREGFNAFRRQISRENVAKDFNRFQQLAKIGSDAARAWQQIAFLHQCVELEGNARWWHYLRLLGIECDHKSFQSDRRDLDYIRRLVPTILSKSNYDYYTIVEFTRHYQIDDSYPALVFAEALLLNHDKFTEDNQECASSVSRLGYQDKIIGVLDDIHDQRLVTMLLKIIPRIEGTDYERLLFVFRLLSERISSAETNELERRVEIVHVLKAFAARGSRLPSTSKNADFFFEEICTESGDKAHTKCDEPMRPTSMICFHKLVSKPRSVLSHVLNTRNFMVLSGLAGPLRLDPDELFMILLKNVVVAATRSSCKSDHHNNTGLSSDRLATLLSTSELERLFEVLANLSTPECKVTAGEWLAENLPLSNAKYRALEFALQSAVTSTSESIPGKNNNRKPRGKSTFTGLAAVTRLGAKVIRVKLQLIFEKYHFRTFVSEQQETKLLSRISQPKELFYELYRQALVHVDSNRSVTALHTIADHVADALTLSASHLRINLIRELLVTNAVYDRVAPTHGGNVKSEVVVKSQQEDIFTQLEEERRSACDENLIERIVLLAVTIASDPKQGSELVEYLTAFARDAKPRAGVTFRAKFRAARVVLHLSQSHRQVVMAFTETTMKAVPFDLAMKEMVRYIAHCKHMITFEEHRVPFDINFILRANKESLVRGLLRQYAHQEEVWIWRSLSELMIDFGVETLDLWQTVLARMRTFGMYRSLFNVMGSPNTYAVLRGIEDAAAIWESTLLAPLAQLKTLASGSIPRRNGMNDVGHVKNPKTKHTLSTAPGLVDDVSMVSYRGISIASITSQLDRMVDLLQQCPVLDQLDVSHFVGLIHELNILSSQQQNALTTVDLLGYAVRCATVIPQPNVRRQTLQSIIQEGGYMQVLRELSVATALIKPEHEPQPHAKPEGDTPWQAEDEIADQRDLQRAAFTEANKRGDHAELFQSPFADAYLGFLADTGEIDHPLAILLQDRNFSSASKLVGLYFDVFPDRARIVDSKSVEVRMRRFQITTSPVPAHWEELRGYIATSSSTLLSQFCLS